ncbi:hypothetical protein CU097_009343 [Rhizopus azygosporus]|uniref:Uncharacterized protein n=1 Tax=Rhizopus azygosporus TaxID=86630 RepID=A0A367J7B7_RHIAZ|nr:hypothetical protein CU097_009343 [Rhizopus azygosporus]
MPPKQSQWNNPMLPHHTVPSMSFSSMSVEDILAHYEPTSDLSEHILLAKEQEEKRRTAEELRQTEEAHLQAKMLEYQFIHPHHHPHHESSSSMLGYVDHFPEQIIPTSSLSTEMNTLFSSDYHYNMIETTSAASSPSLEFVSITSPQPADLCHIPSSPPELPMFPASAPVVTSKPTQRKPRSSIHRTLSYESIMELNTNRPKQSPPPQQPLDHEKVMEALRAKLRKSSSPKPKSAPEPTPPPNTYPTTGVLFLDLKHRRRKASASKRNSYKSI